jgi:hypothetical protein
MTITLASAAALAQPPAAAPVAAAPVAAAPAAVASPVTPQGESPDERMDLAGFRDGFFIRDARDIFRLYPHLLVEADVNTSFGPGVSRIPGTAGDTSLGLEPRLVLRRARFGFDAEVLRRWTVTAILEFAGGQPLGNSNGQLEAFAAKPGATATAASGRYVAAQTVGVAPYPSDVSIGYSVCRCFNVQLGQFFVPFSLDNRTADDYYPLLERPVAIRNFVVSSPRDMGGIVWGELGPSVVNYELGIFGGDGQNRPSVDAKVDFIGRVFVRPFAGSGTSDLAKYTQIGVSGRHGDRDPNKVAYDMPAITTGQGFVLWKPTYTDSLGRLVHVIPSGSQNEVGGELRFQVGRFSLQGEAYYVVNDTREAVDGYQLTNTERFGRMAGVGWYAQLSAWPVGDAFLTPQPGYVRPRHLDLASRGSSRAPHGLEMLVLASGINASYKGATRLDSSPDANTPMSDVTIYQMSVGANYWHTKHARFGVYYSAYITPGSGTTSNQAAVPDNLTTTTAGTPNAGHVLHELSARLALAF